MAKQFEYQLLPKQPKVKNDFHHDQEHYLSYMMKTLRRDAEDSPSTVHIMFPLLIKVGTRGPQDNEPATHPLFNVAPYVLKEMKDESEDPRFNRHIPFNREMIIYIPKESTEDNQTEILFLHHIYVWADRCNLIYIFDPGFERGERLNNNYNEIVRYIRSFVREENIERHVMILYGNGSFESVGRIARSIIEFVMTYRNCKTLSENMLYWMRDLHPRLDHRQPSSPIYYSGPSEMGKITRNLQNAPKKANLLQRIVRTTPQLPKPKAPTQKSTVHKMKKTVVMDEVARLIMKEITEKVNDVIIEGNNAEQEPNQPGVSHENRLYPLIMPDLQTLIQKEQPQTEKNKKDLAKKVLAYYGKNYEECSKKAKKLTRQQYVTNLPKEFSELPV